MSSAAPQSSAEDTIRAAAVIDTTAGLICRGKKNSYESHYRLLRASGLYLPSFFLVCIYDFIPWYLEKDGPIAYVVLSAHEPF